MNHGFPFTVELSPPSGGSGVSKRTASRISGAPSPDSKAYPALTQTTLPVGSMVRLQESHLLDQVQNGGSG